MARSIDNRVLQAVCSEDHVTDMLNAKNIGGHPTKKSSAYSTRLRIRDVVNNDLKYTTLDILSQAIWSVVL